MPTVTSIETEVAPGIVRRTDRGLCIAGTRISLYLVTDYLNAGWPPHLIAHWLGLSEQECSQALSYLDTHRTEFEAEYEVVVKNARARETYYREQARQRISKQHQPNLTPEQAAAMARLAALRREGRY